jgi:hypothetical protein
LKEEAEQKGLTVAAVRGLKTGTLSETSMSESSALSAMKLDELDGTR